MTKIALIAAMAQDRVIGLNNGMPWHLPADLKHFKRLTIGKSIVMGRKTFDSLGKPLPQRNNIVLTRNSDWQVDGVTVYHDIESVLKELSKQKEVMIIGGAHIYAQFLPHATDLYLTQIDLSVQGDTFFPEWNPQQWHLLEEQSFQPDEKNADAYSFMHWRRESLV